MKLQIRDWFLSKPSAREAELIHNLRTQVAQIQIDSTSDVEKKWNDNLLEMQENVRTRDPRNFLQWDVIRYTMFHECKPVELRALQEDSRWKLFESAITGNHIGNPKRYPHLKQSDGNTIHQAYNLLILINNGMPGDLSHKDVIVEFGGGYGDMAKVAYSLGFTGTYVIFDLPIFSALQEYFLKSSNPDLTIKRAPAPLEKNQVILLSDIASLQKQLGLTKPDIFTAMWSLSESPVQLRMAIEKVVAGAKNIHIAYQDWFARDNNTYFKEYQDRTPGYSWVTTPMGHIRGNYYLTGTKS